VSPRWFACTGFVLSVLGCATTYRALPSGSVAPERIVTVRAQRDLGGAIAILRIDGTAVPLQGLLRARPSAVEILAGEHVLEVIFGGDGQIATQSLLLRFRAEAGHSYRIRGATLPEGFGRTLWKHVVGGEGRWTAWIVDETTGVVVSGRALD